MLECTGRFRTRADAAKHLEAGARKVIISAPGKGVDATIVLGVNDGTYDPELHDVISNASCTTNCLAPVGEGAARGVRDQARDDDDDPRRTRATSALVDLPHKDLRRARAPAANIVPTSTGAAKAIGLVIPELEGKLHGVAARVPVLTGSLVDLTVELETRRPTPDESTPSFAERCRHGEPRRASCSYSDEPLVSSDVIKSPYSAVFDSGLTAVSGGTQVKVVAWYDNEWGYSTRLVELAQRVLVPAAVAV